MRRILIALNRYYNNYKTIIWIIIIAIVLFLLLNNAIDKALKKSRNSSSVNNTATIVAVNRNNSTINNSSTNNSHSTGNVSNVTKEKTDQEIISKISSNEEAIKVFVNFCNSSKLDSAYNMLSDNCKEVLYPTKDDFVSNYYNVYFSGFNNISLNKYNGNNTYKVDFKKDAITTGNVTNGNTTDYITVNSDYKLNVSGFIKKKQINKSAENSYLKINVINKYTFLDYENYEVEIENFTTAEMYLDNVDNISKTYLVDKDNKYFNFNIDNYNQNDLTISSNKTKKIKLQFSRTYKENNETIKLIFNNIRIKNYEYTDSNYIDSNVVTGNSQEVIYTKRTTTYPNNVSLQVSLE